MKILLIEDEPGVASFIKKGLEEQQHEVVVAFDGAMGIRFAIENEYDLIILDVNLPLVNGIEVCKKIRKENIGFPVLMLTALGTIDDKVKGLDSGADDYLVKPFQFRELVARVNALGRRRHVKQEDVIIELADLKMNLKTMEVKRGNSPIKLTTKEFRLLEFFFRNKGRVLGRTDIAEALWDRQFDTGSNVVDVYVNYLRNKIDKDYFPKLIHTVYGTGYIFKDDLNAD